MSNFMGVVIFWMGLNRADHGCWRLTLNQVSGASHGTRPRSSRIHRVAWSSTAAMVIKCK